jgi:DNA invertase Pin-like site-specific DNA recombinase
MDLFEVRNRLNSGKSIYEMPLRVTYYARVSTDKDEQLHSLSAQVAYYTDFIKKNANWTYVEGYIDEGLSGTSVVKRESFLRMIEDGKRGIFDFIVTKEISRFSRNTLDSIKYTQELLSAGVGVLFQNDNINTLHADSELRLTIMSSIAQDEVRKLSERVRFGFKRSVENGVVLGSNNILGYKKNKGKLEIVESEAEIVQLIFHLYANEKMGFRAMGHHLNEREIFSVHGNPFSNTTLKQIIQNPKYKGYYCSGKSRKYDYRHKRQLTNSEDWVVYKDYENVPPIVSEELWDKANSIFKKRSDAMKSETNKTSYQNKYRYSGKIWCMVHNAPYHHSSGTGTSKRNICAWRCKRLIDVGIGCKSPTVHTAEIDEIMRQVLQSVFADKEQIINKLTGFYSEISKNSELTVDILKLKSRLSEINKKKDHLFDVSVDGLISREDFKKRNDSLSKEESRIEEQIAECRRQEEQNQNFSSQVRAIRHCVSKELDFDRELCDGAVDELLERIEVYATDTKTDINIKVYLKILGNAGEYNILRQRGKPSAVNCTDKSCPLYLASPV